MGILVNPLSSCAAGLEPRARESCWPLRVAEMDHLINKREDECVDRWL